MTHLTRPTPCADGGVGRVRKQSGVIPERCVRIIGPPAFSRYGPRHLCVGVGGLHHVNGGPGGPRRPRVNDAPLRRKNKERRPLTTPPYEGRTKKNDSHNSPPVRFRIQFRFRRFGSNGWFRGFKFATVWLNASVCGPASATPHRMWKGLRSLEP